MNARQQVEQMCVCLCRQEALYGEWAKAHGMSYNTVMTLYALAQARGCTQKQIAEEWLIPKQTVNTIVKELERQGYVRFEAGRDLKEKLVCFTEAGRAYAESHLRDLYRIEERAMESLSQELRQAMVEGTQASTDAFAREVHRG